MAKKVAKRKTARKATRKKAAVRKKAPAVAAVSPAKKKLKSKGGRPPFKPTDEQRRNVAMMVAIGLRRELCLLVVNPHTKKPISVDTLARHFPHELESGVANAKAQVGSSIVRRALDLNHPQGATCAIFFAKTRMGWKEHNVVEVESKSGVLVAPGAMAVDDWIEAAQRRAASTEQPGTKEDE